MTPRIRSRRGLAGIAAATVTALLGLTACQSAPSAPAVTSVSQSPGSKALKIGISTDEPGVSLKEGTTYSGFDITTATYVAGKLGYSPEQIAWTDLKQSDRESALSSGEVDLVVQTYSMTPERQQKVDFAGPYFVAHQDLLIRRNDDSINGPEKLDGKTLCSVTGTTSAAYVKSRYEGKITLREVPTFSECVRGLAGGDVDAVSTDDIILAGFAATPQYKGVLKVVGKGFTDERYGVGIKKGDSAMVEKVNAALKEYISSGAWKTALEQTVAPSGYSIPAPPTVGS